MNFSKKQKVIIWATVLLALLFLGLRGDSFTGANEFDFWHSTKLYGFPLATWSGEGNVLANRLWDLTENRFYIIAAIVIIGLTAVITSKKK